MLDDFKLAYRLSAALRAHGRTSFIDALPPGSKVLDVGCGNRSPKRFKTQRPDIRYVGLDVSDYNQTAPEQFADQYIVTTPDRFTAEIGKFENDVDAVVSAHNLEHCLHPDEVLEAMLAAVKPGGTIYLSFPCGASVNFPARRGCLNFYDDPSHRNVLDPEATRAAVRAAGFDITFSRNRYRPILPALIGFFFEPVSRLTKRQAPLGCTWALYGFETVIWAKRK